MDKQDIYCYLKEKNLWHEITEHKAVYSMAEISDVALPYPEADGKNLFVRDDKKRNYYLITVKGDKQVDLKEFRKKNGTRGFSRKSCVKADKQSSRKQEQIKGLPGQGTAQLNRAYPPVFRDEGRYAGAA